MPTIWRIGKPYRGNIKTLHEFLADGRNYRVFNYDVDADRRSATKPRCPGILYKAGTPLPRRKSKNALAATTTLNIRFTLARNYRALTLVYNRMGVDVDHVLLDGRRIGVVRGRAEAQLMVWKRRFRSMAKGKHVLTIRNVGSSLTQWHKIDYVQLSGTPVPPRQPPPEPGPEPEVTEPDVGISLINYDGLEWLTEGDEFVEIANYGDEDADISGWRLYADDRGQDFVFPSGTVLEAGATFRVYTNKDDPRTGGFSYGSKRAIWNNQGDLGALFDAEDQLVSTWGYGSRAPLAGVES